MSELSHYIKLRSGLSGCNAKQFECDKYLDCDSCLEDKIKEHDKQIRADAIDDFMKALITMYEKYDIDAVFESSDTYSYTNACYIFEHYIKEIAEELKAGDKNV